MPAPSVKRATAMPSGFDELDRVKLTRAISVEGKSFGPGLMGTIVLCHGGDAYEVEFDRILDVFGIPAEYLEKIQ